MSQGGRFDVADRLFDSIPATWESCLTNMADVKVPRLPRPPLAPSHSNVMTDSSASPARLAFAAD